MMEKVYGFEYAFALNNLVKIGYKNHTHSHTPTIVHTRSAREHS